MTKTSRKDKPLSFEVWVRLGFGLHATFIEHIEKYRPPERNAHPWHQYHRATLTIDPPKLVRKDET